jgi:hypothetical protein
MIPSMLFVEFIAEGNKLSPSTDILLPVKDSCQPLWYSTTEITSVTLLVVSV